MSSIATGSFDASPLSVVTQTSFIPVWETVNRTCSVVPEFLRFGGCAVLTPSVSFRPSSRVRCNFLEQQVFSHGVQLQHKFWTIPRLSLHTLTKVVTHWFKSSSYEAERNMKGMKCELEWKYIFCTWHDDIAPGSTRCCFGLPPSNLSLECSQMLSNSPVKLDGTRARSSIELHTSTHSWISAEFDFPEHSFGLPTFQHGNGELVPHDVPVQIFTILGQPETLQTMKIQSKQWRNGDPTSQS